MTIDVPETDHHIVISADSHCGADLRDYKPYLEKKYHSDFEEWASQKFTIEKGENDVEIKLHYLLLKL